MKKILPFLLIGGAAALYFMSKAGAAKKIKVYFKDVYFGKITGWRLPDIFARFRIVNPTNTALSITSLAGDLYFNKSQLASIQNLEKIDIPANSEIEYKIKIEGSPLQLATTLWSYFKSKQKITLSFDGSVNSGGIVIPIKQIVYQQS